MRLLFCLKQRSQTPIFWKITKNDKIVINDRTFHVIVIPDSLTDTLNLTKLFASFSNTI